MNDDANLSAVCKQVLLAAADGPFFPDWEFSTLFGLERDQVRRIGLAWPSWPDAMQQADAVNASFNMLLGYPHQRWDVWHDHITPISAELWRMYAQWRGQMGLDTSARGTVDRLT